MYNKKSKKKIWIIILVIILLIVGGFCAYKYISKPVETANITEEIKLEKNQELLYVTINQMLGNEMTVYYTDGDSSQTFTWIIPVGTDVVTKLGTTTTFSRLASGDQIKMIVENVNGGQEIIKIWIVN